LNALQEEAHLGTPISFASVFQFDFYDWIRLDQTVTKLFVLPGDSRQLISQYESGFCPGLIVAEHDRANIFRGSDSGSDAA
jgi:hypothetical protein